MAWTNDEFTGSRLGRYEVLCRLAVGGMAELFLGFAREGPLAGQAVVLKRILPEQREDPAALSMLLNEARLTATLHHPNVARVLDLDASGGEVLLVIEFIAGATLEELAEAQRRRGQLLPLGLTLAVLRDAARGLAWAHGRRDAEGRPAPIIHRDVTPRNLMADFDGCTRVLDFGIARARGSQRQTRAGMVRGTTAYMSPEQAVGGALDPRSDLFSLGVLAHELLGGERLFWRGHPGQEMAAVYGAPIPLPSSRNPRVGPALDALVMGLLHREPDRRTASAEAFLAALERGVGEAPWSQAQVAAFVEAHFADRRRAIAALVAGIPAVAPQRPSRRVPVAPPAAPVVAGSAPVAPERPSRRLPVAPPAAPLVTALPPVVPPRPSRRLPVAPTSAADLPTTPGRTPDAPALSPVELAEALAPTVARPAPLEPEPSPLPVPLVAEAAPQLGADPVVELSAPRREGRRLALLLGALAAVAAGAAAGLAVLGPWSAGARPMVPVTLTTDRPAHVVYEGRSLGHTPVQAVFPAGRHRLRLEEPGQGARRFELLADPGASAIVHVALDSLEQLP